MLRKHWLPAFGDVEVADIRRRDAKQWASQVPAYAVPQIIAMFNWAIREEEHDGPNPFAGLATPRGRRDQPPPTDDEMLLLSAACDVHGNYAPTMRAMFEFAAYSGMRPGELYALDWQDIDFDAGTIHVHRQLYRRQYGTPKSGHSRTIALLPPAHRALEELGPLDGGPVFKSKRGQRFSADTLSTYWRLVCARAGVDADFYLCTKHAFVHDAYVRRGLSADDIAHQCGWSRKGAQDLIDKHYGHAEVGAVARIKAAYTDAQPMHEVRDAAS